jgi:ubiquinone/menaquinone biosynthesis C-methylase UbiE
MVAAAQMSSTGPRCTSPSNLPPVRAATKETTSFGRSARGPSATGALSVYYPSEAPYRSKEDASLPIMIPSDLNAGAAMDYDAELRMHNEILRRSYGIGPHDRVLDIGCGAGQTTRDAARLAMAGSVLGVDVSPLMIERARRLTKAAGLRNVTFEQADAEHHGFTAERFDVAISRFGTMFFTDAIAGFRNIARAIHPNGRLVMMVWQDHHRNEWSVSIHRALATGAGMPIRSLGAPDPFSLADPATTERVLETAGFTDVAFTAVHEPVYYGPDVAGALDWVRGFSCVKDVLEPLDRASTERAGKQLIHTLAAHARGDGVWFDSSAWIVTARRR